LLAGIHDQEAAGPVGGFGHAWLGTELPKQGCLLITGYAGNGDFGIEHISCRLGEYLTATFYFWK
jgi:hypothetical protein